MKSYQRIAVAAAVVGVVALGQTVGAGTRLDLERRYAEADTVLIAHVCGVTADWVTVSYGTIIMSRATLCPDEIFKSDAAGPYVLEIAGGTVDGITMGVSDLPLIKDGGRALFFLDRNESDPAVLNLSSQGLGYFTFLNKNQVSDYYGVLTATVSLLRNIAASN